MKYTKESIKLVLLVSAAISISLTAHSQGTAFTYQGVLNDTGATANGLYDLQLTIYDSDTNGNVVAGPLTNSAVVVSNGLFTTTVDFGAGVFLGQPLWLDIAVSTNGLEDFAELTPRQMLTPTPYSIFSANAGYSTVAGTASTADTVVSGAVSAPQLSTPTAPAAGQVLAFDGTQLVWQAPVIGGGSGGWSLSGNLGTTPGLNFLGTIDSKPLELKVAGVRAFRLEPDSSGNGSPNVIGGSSGNYVSNTVIGATIAGGGGTASVSNMVIASWGAIGGGANNLAGGTLSYVGGGYQNIASGYIATVAGGAYNSAVSNESAVLGGAFNVASGIGSVVAGGGWDGSNPSGNAARGTGSAIGGGLNNGANGAEAAISGGYGNGASGSTAFVGGGNGNSASGSDLVPYHSGQFIHFIAGGSTVSGGNGNSASSTGATVPGGAFNVASGDLSFAAGYRAVAAGGGTFVWSDESSDSPFTCSGANQFVIRAAGGVGIGTTTPAAALDVNGSFHASGPLMIGDNFTATIGCADLEIGYSGRRGSPGRALTDFGTSLQINCCGDWPVTYFGGGNVSVCSLTIRGGCDLAEPFTTTEPELASGSVVIIDPEHPGQLKCSDTAYDTRVAGVISGANGVNPGIALHQEGTFDGGQNVALTGRVYVLADASNGAILPGDLLTTSSTPGHAMKVKDHAKAQGAILGKAMSGLLQGKGMVLVLVTLE